MPITITPAATSGSIDVNGIPAVTFNSGGTSEGLYSITAAVAANALTVTLQPCVVKFRSATLTSGAPTTVAVNAALTLTVPDTATLGTLAAVSARLPLILINNAGVGELAIGNLSGGRDLSESGVISTVIMDTASDGATVIYSAVARTSVAYKVVGYVNIQQATAGTWTTAPTLVQGVGGQVMGAMGSLGYGQTWQNVTASRTAGTTYYNTTGKPIIATIGHPNTVQAASPTAFTVDGVIVSEAQGSNNVANAASGTYALAIVPPGSSYVGSGVFNRWTELR